MPSSIGDMLTFPARLGASAILAATLLAIATVATELAPSGEDPTSASSQPRLPRPVHDLVLLENGRYAVIRFPGQLAVAESPGDAPLVAVKRLGSRPLALAGPNTDGRVLTSFSDGSVRSWTSAESDGVEWQFIGNHDGPADMLCMSADGRRAAAVSAGAHNASSDQSPVTVWDLNASTSVQFRAPGSIDWVGFCADSDRLVMRATDGTVSVWRATNGSHLDTICCGPSGKGFAACSPAGALLAWCGPAEDGVGRLSVRLHDLDVGECLWDAAVQFQNSAAPYHQARLAFSGDGALLACGTADTVALFDAGDGRILATAPATWHRVAGLQFTADGRLLVSAGRDGTVRWWGLPGLPELFRSEDLVSD